MVALLAHKHYNKSVETPAEPSNVAPTYLTREVDNSNNANSLAAVTSSSSGYSVESPPPPSPAQVQLPTTSNATMALVMPKLTPSASTQAQAALMESQTVPQLIAPATNTIGSGGSNTPILPSTASPTCTGQTNQNIIAVTPNNTPPMSPTVVNAVPTPTRLNKFVRRLHDMLQSERNSGIVEWRRGLLVLHSTDAFAKTILPRYFNTRNFKTFRRQLNYYGFVHVRSFSATGSTTTALWVNRDLAKRGTASISSVLMLKRVEPCESAKTAEGRRVRKKEAVSTVEEDIGVSAKSLQLDQIRSMALRTDGVLDFVGHHDGSSIPPPAAASVPSIPMIVHCHQRPNSTVSSVNTTPLPSTAASSPTPMAMVAVPPRPPLWQPENCTVTDSILTTKIEEDRAKQSSSADDAANLLLMLSRSAVPSSSSPNCSPSTDASKSVAPAPVPMTISN